MQIDKSHIYINLDVRSRDEFFDFISKKLYKGGFVKENYSQALKEREKEFPTGLPLEIGVAIPHTSSNYVNKDTFAISVFKNPIIFQEMGGDPDSIIKVKIAISIVMTDGDKHLEALQKLISSIQDKVFLEKISNAKKEEEIQELFRII